MAEAFETRTSKNQLIEKNFKTYWKLQSEAKPQKTSENFKYMRACEVQPSWDFNNSIREFRVPVSPLCVNTVGVLAFVLELLNFLTPVCVE